MTDLHTNDFGQWRKFTLTTSPIVIYDNSASYNAKYFLFTFSDLSTAFSVTYNDGTNDFEPISSLGFESSSMPFSIPPQSTGTMKVNAGSYGVNVFIFKDYLSLKKVF